MIVSPGNTVDLESSGAGEGPGEGMVEETVMLINSQSQEQQEMRSEARKVWWVIMNPKKRQRREAGVRSYS